jgi:hypothetical protein
MKAGKQPNQSQVMISMEVRNEDGGNFGGFDFKTLKLMLCTLPTIQ